MKTMFDEAIYDLTELGKINIHEDDGVLEEYWTLEEHAGLKNAIKILEEAKKIEESRSNIVTICGSTKFKDQMMTVAKQLTLEGKVVLMPLVFAHQGDVITDDDKKRLDKLHCQKIDLASTIYVVMVDSYIGESTRNEIKYSELHNKEIIYRNFEKTKEGIGLKDKNMEKHIMTPEDINLIELVKFLREETGIGMAQCRDALLECNLDIEKAKAKVIKDTRSW